MSIKLVYEFGNEGKREHHFPRNQHLSTKCSSSPYTAIILLWCSSSGSLLRNVLTNILTIYPQQHSHEARTRLLTSLHARSVLSLLYLLCWQQLYLCMSSSVDREPLTEDYDPVNQFGRRQVIKWFITYVSFLYFKKRLSRRWLVVSVNLLHKRFNE